MSPRDVAGRATAMAIDEGLSLVMTGRDMSFVSNLQLVVGSSLTPSGTGAVAAHGTSPLKLHEAVAEAHVIQEDCGTITLTAGVLAEVVARSTEEVDGARLHRRRRGLEIDVGDGRARVSLELAVRYGEVLPEVAGAVQRRVADGLLSICGLYVDAVDVSVEELERS